MNINLIVSGTAVLVGCMIGLVYYMQAESGDDSYLLQSKWSITTADGTDQTWWIDTESGGIKIASKLDGGNTLHVEEFVGGNKYSYTTAGASGAFDADAFCAFNDAEDCASLAAELAIKNAALATTWASSKANCKVEAAAVTTNSASVNSDGSLTIGGFTVQMTDGSPTAILVGGPDRESGDVIATINGFEETGAISFDGCTEADDRSGGDSARRRATVVEDAQAISEARRKLGAVSEAQMKAREQVNAMFMDYVDAEFHEEVARHLSWTSFQAWISNTNWCGAGTDLANTVCPSSTASGDLQADRACRRHDHGAKSNGIIGGMAVRLGCDIDRDLATSTSNWCAQGIFGSWGLAQVWGCFDHGSYSCWNWANKWWGGYWRYGDYCNGEHVHYGPWRYDSFSHRYGYKAKAKSCNGDIW